MEQGWDPEVKQFFLKILNTISLSLSWALLAATLGLYFGWAYNSGRPFYTHILFYTIVPGTLVLLIRHLYKLWKW